MQITLPCIAAPPTVHLSSGLDVNDTPRRVSSVTLRPFQWTEQEWRCRQVNEEKGKQVTVQIVIIWLHIPFQNGRRLPKHVLGHVYPRLLRLLTIPRIRLNNNERFRTQEQSIPPVKLIVCRSCSSAVCDDAITDCDFLSRLMSESTRSLSARGSTANIYGIKLRVSQDREL